MKLSECPTSGLLLPPSLIEEKASLKNEINRVVEDAVNSVELSCNYYLVLHAKFDEIDPSTFVISQLVASIKLPPFTTNQMCFFVSPRRGIVELLWQVGKKEKGKPVKPEFNVKGVAYLQAKGVLPTAAG